jgi:hypothetical protein
MKFPRYGWVGLGIIVAMETAILAVQLRWATSPVWLEITGWATPACWWGYILAVDAWIFRRNGRSWLMNRRADFVILCIFSIAFWCLFEAYNRVMPAWQYINLDEDIAVRFVGYAISFASIGPALFLTTELLQTHGLFALWRGPKVRWTPQKLRISVLVGIIFCLVPPFFGEQFGPYLWASVWTGWIFLLEPMNYERGGRSIYRDLERGDWSRALQLMFAGGICGVLWEFWNMWAFTKWIYIFPLGQDLKFFEMPLIGFLGFLPFAIEYFVMFHFIALFFTREDKLGI